MLKASTYLPEFKYDDLGFMLLGYLIEEISGQSLEQSLGQFLAD